MSIKNVASYPAVQESLVDVNKMAPTRNKSVDTWLLKEECSVDKVILRLTRLVLKETRAYHNSSQVKIFHNKHLASHATFGRRCAETDAASTLGETEAFHQKYRVFIT